MIRAGTILTIIDESDAQVLCAFCSGRDWVDVVARALPSVRRSGRRPAGTVLQVTSDAKLRAASGRWWMWLGMVVSMPTSLPGSPQARLPRPTRALQPYGCVHKGGQSMTKTPPPTYSGARASLQRFSEAGPGKRTEAGRGGAGPFGVSAPPGATRRLVPQVAPRWSLTEDPTGLARHPSPAAPRLRGLRRGPGKSVHGSLSHLSAWIPSRSSP